MNRLYVLDLFRFLLALGVMVGHYVTIFGECGLSEYFRFGMLGVHGFFILSGFLIYESAVASNGLDFILRRIVRLYPAFIVCSIITFALCNWAGAGITPKTWLANLTFFPGFLFGEGFVDGVYWTLSYEISFYFMVFMVLMTGRLKNLIYPFLIGWLVLAFIWTSGRFEGGLRQFFSANYAPLFIVGVAINLYVRKKSILPLIIIAVSMGLGIYNEWIRTSQEKNPLSFYEIVIVGIIVASTLIVWASTKFSFTKYSKAFVFLGGVSYPLYLLHQRVAIDFVNASILGKDIYSLLMMAALALILSVGVYLIELRVRPSVKGFLTSSVQRILSLLPKKIAIARQPLE